MIKALLFDMDGIVVDSERIAREFLIERAADFGYTVSREFYVTLLGQTYEKDVESLVTALGPDVPADELLQYPHRMINELSLKGQLPVKDGFTECMDALHAAGIHTALVTSTMRDRVETRIAAIPALQHRFKTLVCDGEAKHGKPAPDPYLLAAEKLGLRPDECLGVEDSEAGLRSLHDGGIPSVMVPDLLPYGDRVAPYAQYKVNSLRELPELVSRINHTCKEP